MLRNINLQNPSKAILKREGKLKILLDAECFNHSLDNNDLVDLQIGDKVFINRI